MAYTLTPFSTTTRYQHQVKNELGIANNNFTIIGQAFYNNDPTSQPILRAVYIGSSAPSNPVADMLWYDTTNKVLNLYDGNNWITINNSSGSSSNSNTDQQIDTLNSAFLNKDPSSQPILRAVYINSSAPSNPVADMLWYDTSSNLLKLYDGNNWNAINDVSTLKSQITSLNSAFFSNDPTQTILRATYIGSTAPSNPVAGTTWLDTSQSTPTLKIYDGSNWQAISGGSSSSSSSNNRVDLSNATSDYNLAVGQEAIINFNNASSVALHIATQSGTMYHLYIFLTAPSFAQGNAVRNTPASLLPNNTSYSSAFYRSGVVRDNAGGAAAISGSVSSFDLIYDVYPANCFAIIYNETSHKSVMAESVSGGYDGNNYARSQREMCVWNDYSTAWTSLGTITFPKASSGYILVRRIA